MLGVARPFGLATSTFILEPKSKLRAFFERGHDNKTAHVINRVDSYCCAGFGRKISAAVKRMSCCLSGCHPAPRLPESPDTTLEADAIHIQTWVYAALQETVLPSFAIDIGFLVQFTNGGRRYLAAPQSLGNIFYPVHRYVCQVHFNKGFFHTALPAAIEFNMAGHGLLSPFRMSVELHSTRDRKPCLFYVCSICTSYCALSYNLWCLNISSKVTEPLLGVLIYEYLK